VNRGWTGGAALLALSLAGTAGAQDSSNLPSQERYGLRLQYQEFRPSLTGQTQKGSGSTAGSVVDVNADLGLADKRTFDVRGAVQFKKGWKLRGSYTPLHYDGDVESGRTFTYGDTRVVRFDRVRTSVKGGYYSGDLEYDFVKGPHGFLGAVVGAKLIDVDSALVDVSTNAREVDTLTSPIPVIGLTGRGYAGKLSFQGEISGLSAGSHGSALEAEGSVRLHISDHLAASGGYRYLSLDAKHNLDEVKVKLGGWVFGLELSL
jgi:hypothetical protein